MESDGKTTILLTFDVEDWFQVENFKGAIPFSSWNHLEFRVRQNTSKILGILDDFPFRVSATFFILGWVAERSPELLKDILAQGHEIASHGYGHDLCTQLGEDELAADLSHSKSLLEDLTGRPIQGYRAPSFSISPAGLEQVRRAGYSYDSSYNSFGAHGRYGHLNLHGMESAGCAYHLGNGFYEIPISNLRVKQTVFPLGGGGYFRLFPFPMFKLAVDQVLRRDNAFVFYSHPWEFDPDQPRVSEVPPMFRFRHYVNLHRTEAKLRALVSAYNQSEFSTLHQYVETRQV
ncbi:MAG: DUF3473 domain-containing protein [Desulfobacterales bacterium]|nr:DUF3473 domain-containing protein [Desulfobacterales bacterium]